MLGQLRHMAVILMLLNAVVAGAARVHADETAPDRATVGERRSGDIEKEIDELRRHIEILTEEVRKMKEREVIPETAELKSVYGMATEPSLIPPVGRPDHDATGGGLQLDLGERTLDKEELATDEHR